MPADSEGEQILTIAEGMIAEKQKSIEVRGAARSQSEDHAKFFENTPSTDQRTSLFTVSARGVKVREIDDPLTQKIRRPDKPADKLAKGKPMAKTLRETRD